jgi:signal transduction histidine kinase
MRTRADELGGQLEITSAPGRGTNVCVEVPAGKTLSRDDG